MRLFSVKSLLLSSFFVIHVPAQQPVDPTARYSRAICIVKMVGAGTHEEPLRPDLVPASAEEAAKAGIIAWSVLPGDDPKMAIVHIVAKNQKALDAITKDKKERPDLKVFEVGKHRKTDVERELKLYRKDFNLEKFEVIAR